MQPNQQFAMPNAEPRLTEAVPRRLAVPRAVAVWLCAWAGVACSGTSTDGTGVGAIADVRDGVSFGLDIVKPHDTAVLDLGTVDNGQGHSDLGGSDGDDDLGADPVDVADVAAADDVTADTGGPQLCSKTCEIADDCDPEADPCTAPACVLGCCQPQPTVGALCDDGIACNGPDTCKGGICVPSVPTGCDDALLCTKDTCDGTDCHHDLLPGWCQIGASCVQEGTSLPGNPCQACIPAVSTTDWSPLPGCCKADKDCPGPGDCDIPQCDVLSGKCHIAKKSGCCKGALDCDDADPCTTDSCDVGSGNCLSVAVVCDSPSACQTASCNPTTGACDPSLLPGWCAIDGECHKNGEFNATNACQLCQPALAKDAWSAKPGTPCDDGNACTFSDICKDTGECQGFAQPGCCQTDLDCDDGGQTCKMGHCNTSVGLCALVDKPNCCTSGVCCDTTAQVPLAANTACGTVVIATEYQCNGQDILKRDLFAGCTGQSASTCSTDAANLAPGPWETLQTCDASTKCNLIGSNITPTCDVIGSCVGACGGNGSGSCSCASGCVPGVSCCPDFQAVCGCTSGDCCEGGLLKQGLACAQGQATQYQCSGKTIQKRTGSGVCTGAGACNTDPGALVWGAWTDVEQCPNQCVVAPDGSSASCPAPAGTCSGGCGSKWTSQACWCDTNCLNNNDCCADFFTMGCGTVQACGADLGHSCYQCNYVGTGGCSCDASVCIAAGNCCPDAGACCY